jgi:hypothetical protein
MKLNRTVRPETGWVNDTLVEQGTRVVGSDIVDSRTLFPTPRLEIFRTLVSVYTADRGWW